MKARLIFAVLFSAICVSGRAQSSTGSISEIPLAPHPFPPGKTMFAELPPEETGLKIDNKYDDPRMWGDLYQEFESGSLGTGVAVGDYDGDGRPDIFVVSKTDGCRLFRNLGNYKFEDVTAKAGVGGDPKIWKQGATFVDINNDGLLDIYVCQFNAPNLLYINQGDGTFKEMAQAYGLDVKDASVMAAFCDYDRDGWLDVYISTNLSDSAHHPKGQRGYLFHNNRNGTFTNVTDVAGITGESQSHSATWWDYDNDGWPDLYVANDYGVPDKLYHNNRDGTFTDTIDSVVPHTSFYSMGSDLGDVNNDGLIDLFVADMAASTHEKDQHSVAESRNKNADPLNPAVAPKYVRSALLLNTGMGRMRESAYLAGIAATDWTWSVRFEDLDNDGRLDLAVTNGFNRDPNPDLHQKSMEAESTADRIRNMYNAPVLNETHFAFRNLGELHFENESAAWGLDQKGVSFGAAFGDFGGSGNMDMVYTNYQAGVTFLRNDNNTGHRVIVDLRGTRSNRFGVGAVVRIESALGQQVRSLVLARGYLSSSEPNLHFGLGSDTVIKRLTVEWPSGEHQVFDNLGVDRHFTITEPSSASVPRQSSAPPDAGLFTEVSASLGLQIVSAEEPVDELYLQKLLPLRLNRRGPALAVGSLSPGEDESVFVGGTTVTKATLLKSAGGAFSVADTSALLPIALIDDGPVLIFDADGDGLNDLLVTKGGNSQPPDAAEYQPKLYINDGHGGFRPAAADALPTLTNNIGAAAACDFTRNGYLGLFLGGRVLTGQYPFSPASVLLLNHGGKFEDITDTFAPALRNVGMVTSALWSDVDGDGWLDLLVTIEWGQVKYFHNNQGRGLEDWTEKAGFSSAGTGWWTSLAAADFNGDGKMDYVVGNVGLNTPYRADPGHPAVLLSGDFKGSGSNQLIEACYEGDRLVPWRSRHVLGASIPAVLKRFPLNGPYARADLAEILGADKIAAAQKFTATELRSGVFLSQPDGNYRFQPLPAIAQIAPLQGLVAADFDGDGHADIYAVQNSYAPIPSVGRFDGGVSQLLLGDGEGHFKPVPPLQSHLLVTGDAKALAVVDLDKDGWPDFVVTRNNNTTLAFHNNRAAGRHSLRVLLRGLDGNPSAVGARVTVELSDGTTQTSEVYAGSGYYSQSSPACFFGYRDSNVPIKLRVRWPSGISSNAPISANASSMTLRCPSAPPSS